MSTLPSHIAEVAPRRASTLLTFFILRIIIAVLLTGLDGLVFSRSILDGLRNSTDLPLLHMLLIAAVPLIAITLAIVWYKTLRYRQPSEPNSHNPFL